MKDYTPEKEGFTTNEGFNTEQVCEDILDIALGRTAFRSMSGTDDEGDAVYVMLQHVFETQSHEDVATVVGRVYKELKDFSDFPEEYPRQYRAYKAVEAFLHDHQSLV